MSTQRSLKLDRQSSSTDLSADTAFLRCDTRPNYEQQPDPIVVADLFSGAGGLTLGLAEAAKRAGRGLDVALAVDFDGPTSATFAANFPKALTVHAPVESLFDGELGTPLTRIEETTARDTGPIDFLVGGPPCQGHSDLNNYTRRRDPRNRFYERMGRAAEVLRPRVVVIENVPTVRNDTGRAVQQVTAALRDTGYSVADAVVSLLELGVPQRRRRHALLGVHDVDADPVGIFASLSNQRNDRTLRWAIGDLDDSSTDPFDSPSVMSDDNAARASWLLAHEGSFDLPNNLRPECHRGDHSYVSMYGQLRWDAPAQTITSGYGSMGQGRYLHPSRPRTLTPHEASRIQFFPDWFDFTAGGLELRRGKWAQMIGNAVPPKLTMELGRLLIPSLTAVRSVRDAS